MLIIIAVLLAAMPDDFLAQDKIQETNRAVVFWNGVHGCKPSPKSNYDYIWQENTDNLMSSLENRHGEFAQPFGIMSRKHDSPQKVAEDIDSYLQI